MIVGYSDPEASAPELRPAERRPGRRFEFAHCVVGSLSLKTSGMTYRVVTEYLNSLESADAYHSPRISELQSIRLPEVGHRTTINLTNLRAEERRQDSHFHSLEHHP